MIIKIYSLGFLLLIVDTISAQTQCPNATETHLCDADFCTRCYSGCIEPEPSPPDLQGVKLKIFREEDDFCDCCESVLIPFLEEGDPCFQKLQSVDIQDRGVCGPQLSCQLREGSSTDHRCLRKKTMCLLEQDSYDQKLQDGTLGIDESKPTCDENGYYDPLQCIFAGICRCVDKKTGFPAFGFTLNIEGANAEGVDCGCGTHVNELRHMSCPMEVDYNGGSEGSIQQYIKDLKECEQRDDYYFQDTLRCLPSGDFDHAQCMAQVLEGEDDTDFGEICFCIDDEANYNSSASAVVHIELASSMLDCHSVDDLHPEGYYRPCEAEYREKTRQIKGNFTVMDATYVVNGTTHNILSDSWIPNCSPDGYYNLKQKARDNSENGYCSNKHNEQIEEFAGVYVQMDCLCAQVRDAMLKTDDRPSCLTNGSFNPKQCRGERCYCVNEFGKQVSLEKYITEMNDNCEDTYWVRDPRFDL